MAYIVEEKGPIKIVGLSKRIDNLNTASQEIGKVWENFIDNQLYGHILNQVDEQTFFGIYTDYDEKGHYTFILGAQVTSLDEIPEGMVGKNIPKGSYVVYKIRGMMPESLIDFWKNLWESNLDYQRRFSTDIEKYELKRLQAVEPEVEVYIAKE